MGDRIQLDKDGKNIWQQKHGLDAKPDGIRRIGEAITKAVGGGGGDA